MAQPAQQPVAAQPAQQPPQNADWWAAVRTGDWEGVAAQLSEDASLRDAVDPRTVRQSCRRAIHEAAGLGHNSVVVVLVDNGADPLLQDKFGRTPLMLAGALGRKDVMHTLLCAIERTAGPNIGRAISGQDVEKQSALHHAAIAGDRECLGMLLRRGACDGMEGKQGFTPAEFATRCGRIADLSQVSEEVRSERTQRGKWNRAALAFIHAAAGCLPEDILRDVWLSIPSTLPDVYTWGSRASAQNRRRAFGLFWMVNRRTDGMGSAEMSQIDRYIPRPGVNRERPNLRRAGSGEGCCLQ